MRDDLLRSACFAALDRLRARFGEELPYAEALAPGFQFDGRRVPFLNYQKGIYRAAAQTGPAALSINTSANSPYDDAATEAGLVYAYRAGSIDQADNRALRAAFDTAVPLVYFVSHRPGWYQPEYPCYVIEDDPHARRVLVARGTIRLLEPYLSDDPLDRAYALREARVRLHQGRFRGLVLPAYRDRCAICSLRESRLLDAAHITADADPGGAAEIRNGVSLCSIHHRAYDNDLVAIDPDYRVHIAPRLLEDEDGPMLELLKTFQGQRIILPTRVNARPDRERLAARFERFSAA